MSTQSPALKPRTTAWPASLSAASMALALLAGCATPPAPVVTRDRVILLPQADDSPSAVEVIAGGQRLLLDRPFASAELRNGSLAATQSDAETVRKTYGTLLAQQPARPRSFTVQFEANGSRLVPSAAPVITAMRDALAALPAAEVVITGHTDRVGSIEANDRLSLVRAETVREILVAAGLARAGITVVGRGEREPVVPTADEVAEARNRRVEIKIR